MDPNLRLSSIWALKHLVLSAPRLLKKECLEELGPGWLKQMICDDEADSASVSGTRSNREASTGTPLAMGTPNAAGERVDLLNATDGTGESRQAINEDDDDDSKMADGIGILGGLDLVSQQQGHQQVLGGPPAGGLRLVLLQVKHARTTSPSRNRGWTSSAI